MSKIRIISLILVLFFFITSCKQENKNKIKEDVDVTGIKPAGCQTNSTNDFYDDGDSKKIPVSKLTVKGEVEKSYVVDFSKLPTYKVLLAEAQMNDSSFVGAYEYSGYSLHDILDKAKIKKKNIHDFRPIVDLYVEVRNSRGETVIFSWGEIFYPTDRNKVIIANKVTRIVPKKTKMQWKFPEKSKIIAGCDFFPVRNIENPTEIIIHSLDDFYTVNRTIKMQADTIKIKEKDKLIKAISELPNDLHKADVSSVFYGKGLGFHGIKNFKGAYLKDFLQGYFSVDKEKMQKGMFVIVGIDGYRAAFTFAEVMNRNDFKEFILIDKYNYEKAGKFSVFAPADFFSDRAIKSVKEIKFYNVQ